MKNKTFSPGPNARETRWGFTYLALQLLVLPTLLPVLNIKLRWGLDATELNFVFFLLNFLVILWIFHDFLGRSARKVWQHPASFLQAVVLGAAAYFACTQLVGWGTNYLAPEFSNANDAFIASLSRSNFFLMVLGTVVLAPLVEECLYRGLIFRKLYGKSKWAAYLISMLAFAMIHIMGYLGRYSPLEVGIALLQYLPAGLWLAWSYIKADTIFAPILIHSLINAVAFCQLR